MTKEVPPISRIVLTQLRQNVEGAFASQLAAVLEPLGDDTPAILDFSAVNSIDGYGINIIAEALARGVNIYLVGVRGRVRRMFRQAQSISESRFVDSVDEALDSIDADRQEPATPGAERRRARRIRAHIPVELVLDIDGRRIPTEGIIRNLSEGGVYIELVQKLSDIIGDEIDLDTSFDLRFALPDTSYPCLAQGVAAHAEVSAAGLCYGVRFSELSYLDEDAIRTFLYRHDPDRRAGTA